MFPHVGFENVAFPLKLRKIAIKEKNRRVTEALKTVQLSDFLSAVSTNYQVASVGVLLARALYLVQNFVDGRAFVSLDKKLREEMQIELKQLHRQLGVTTVYVTHDQREALTMSDRIAVINDGELAQVGTPRDIYNAPVSHFVASFIGESSFGPDPRQCPCIAL